MVVKFLDPYKDDKYGKIRGDKSDCYFKVTFSEAKVYKTDDAYIIAGEVSAYEGVTRSYKPELFLEPGLCALPIYGQEYEIRRKDGNDWITDKVKPGIFELAAYNWIKQHEASWMDDSKTFTGSFTNPPDGMIADHTQPKLEQLVDTNLSFEDITPTGKLESYEPPKTYGSNGKGGGKSYGMQPSEKYEWIKKQLATDIISPAFTGNESMIKLIEQVLIEQPMENDVSSTYFDCLLACIK
jgi:hypothetical protein